MFFPSSVVISTIQYITDAGEYVEIIVEVAYGVMIAVHTTAGSKLFGTLVAQTEQIIMSSGVIDYHRSI